MFRAISLVVCWLNVVVLSSWWKMEPSLWFRLMTGDSGFRGGREIDDPRLKDSSLVVDVSWRGSSRAIVPVGRR